MASVTFKLYLGQSSSAKAQVRIRVEDAQLCESNHGCFLYAGMSLLGTVGDQLGEKDALLDKRVQGFQFLDLLSTGGQQADQHALASR